jgi:hypothetical protein
VGGRSVSYGVAVATVADVAVTVVIVVSVNVAGLVVACRGRGGVA